MLPHLGDPDPGTGPSSTVRPYLLGKPRAPTAQTQGLYSLSAFRTPIYLSNMGRATIPSTGYSHPNHPSPALLPLPEITRASRSRRFTGGGGVAGVARRGCGGT